MNPTATNAVAIRTRRRAEAEDPAAVEDTRLGDKRLVDEAAPEGCAWYEGATSSGASNASCQLGRPAGRTSVTLRARTALDGFEAAADGLARSSAATQYGDAAPPLTAERDPVKPFRSSARWWRTHRGRRRERQRHERDLPVDRCSAAVSDFERSLTQ